MQHLFVFQNGAYIYVQKATILVKQDAKVQLYTEY
jgi:hypothetical protein